MYTADIQFMYEQNLCAGLSEHFYMHSHSSKQPD